jgi:hypothetical protein
MSAVTVESSRDPNILKANEKPTNALIFQYIDTRHSPTCFGTLKCHHQGINHDPAEIGAKCIDIKDGLKYIINNIKCV